LRLIPTLAIALLLQTSAKADDDLADRVPFQVLSNGAITCGEFLADGERTQASDTEWVLGYITGRNRVAPLGSRNAGSSFTAPAAVTAWLQDYCRTHALDYLIGAAEALRIEFLRREAK
jgi:hypothetical protein